MRPLALVAALLSLARASAQVRSKASSLEDWIDGLTLEIDVDYKDKFSGITVEVKDVECEDLEMDIIRARYDAPRTLYVDLDDVNGNCEGDYKWNYKTGIGKVKGDGKVEVKVRNSRIEVDLDVEIDAAGAPLNIEVKNCDAKIKITDIDTRGDALGSAANPFLDDFADFFIDDIENLVCNSLEDQSFRFDKIIQSSGFGNCMADVGMTSSDSRNQTLDDEGTKVLTEEEDSDLVDWDTVVKTAVGPGARLVSALYKAVSKPKAADVVAFALDAAGDFGVPLAGDDVLDVSRLALINMDLDRDAVDPDLLTNLSLSLRNATIATNIGSLNSIPRKDLVAYADGRSGGSEVRVGLHLPDAVALNLSTALEATFAFDYIADWIDQRMKAPVLTLRTDLALDVSDIGADATLAVAVSPRRTRQGLDGLLLGDVTDLTCLKEAAALVDVSVPHLALNYKRSKLRVTRPTFVSTENDPITDVNSLEFMLAQSVLPAVIDLVDHGLTDFVECVVDQLIDVDATETLTKEVRHFFGVVSHKKCGERRRWTNGTEDFDERVVDLEESRIVRRLARELADFRAEELVKVAVETISEGDVERKYKVERRLSAAETARSRFLAMARSPDFLDHVIVVAKSADKIRIGPLGTTLRIRDVFVANLDRAIGNVTLFPGGTSSLKGTTVEVLGKTDLAMEVPVIAGLAMSVETPVGDAELAINVTLSRIEIVDFFVNVYVDEPTLNSLNVGQDLGLSSLFTEGAKFPLPSCLAASLQAVSVAKLPKLHVGAVGIDVWSDVDGIPDVVEATAKAAVKLVNDLVSTKAVRGELTWLLNDAIHKQLQTARETCEKQTNAEVAPRRDARGERPSAADNSENDGVDGDLALAADAFSVFVVIAVMFATFILIWLQRKHRASAKGALDRFIKRPIRKIFSSSSPDTKAKDDATSFAEAYVGGDDGDEDSVDVARAIATSIENERRRPLIQEAPLPFVLRYGLLAIMIGNIGLLVSSNIEIAAQARIRLSFDLLGNDETVWLNTDSRFSLIDSVTQLWDAGSILLALLVALLSGAWPYIEIGLLIWGYITPGLEPKRREWVWRSVEMLSKWSFIDVFIVVFLIVAFYIDVDLRFRNTAGAQAELFIEARYAFYAFCFATLTSMCLGQVLLNLHREVHHLGRSRFHALEQRLEEPKKKSPRRSLTTHPLEGKPPRWWQKLVLPAILGVAGLLAAALTVTAVVFEVNGAAGLLIDITEGSDKRNAYSAPEIPIALLDTTPNDGWRPLVRILTGIVLVFAVAVPALHIVLLGALWGLPLTAPTQIRLLALAEVAYGWASLDVYLVTILATATQVNKLSENLAKDQCRSIDGYLQAFFDQAIDGDLSCFSIGVQVRPGCVLLAVACAAQMILGYLTSSITTACVAERVVETAVGDREDLASDQNLDIELTETTPAKKLQAIQFDTSSSSSHEEKWPPIGPMDDTKDDWIEADV